MNDLSYTPPARKSWLVDSDAAPQKAPPNLAMQIMNIMEQDIIEWSADGICEMHNTRIYDVLELVGEDIGIGTERDTFLKLAEARGEFDADARKAASIKFNAHKPFSFDRLIPSGRIVS
ncbi:MAG: hypothetical protein QNK98_00210, partial [Yoonia sp.]